MFIENIKIILKASENCKERKNQRLRTFSWTTLPYGFSVNTYIIQKIEYMLNIYYTFSVIKMYKIKQTNKTKQRNIVSS